MIKEKIIISYGFGTQNYCSLLWRFSIIDHIVFVLKKQIK